MQCLLHAPHMALWNIRSRKPFSSARKPFSLETMSLAIFWGLKVSLPVARYVRQLYLHISAHMAHLPIFSASFLSSAIDKFSSIQYAFRVECTLYGSQKPDPTGAQFLF